MVSTYTPIAFTFLFAVYKLFSQIYSLAGLLHLQYLWKIYDQFNILKVFRCLFPHWAIPAKITHKAIS